MEGWRWRMGRILVKANEMTAAIIMHHESELRQSCVYSELATLLFSTLFVPLGRATAHKKISTTAQDAFCGLLLCLFLLGEPSPPFPPP